jgi:hypothetical protein
VVSWLAVGKQNCAKQLTQTWEVKEYSDARDLARLEARTFARLYRTKEHSEPGCRTDEVGDPSHFWKASGVLVDRTEQHTQDVNDSAFFICFRLTEALWVLRSGHWSRRYKHGKQA